MRKIILIVAALSAAPLAWAQEDAGAVAILIIPLLSVPEDGGALFTPVAASENEEPAPSGQSAMGENLSDPRLLEEIHANDLVAIEEASLAEDNARSEQIKRFAEDMKRTHAEMDREVVTVATRLGVAVGDTLHEDGMAAIVYLKGTTDSDFDRTFLKTAANLYDVLNDKIDAAEKANPRVAQLVGRVQPELRELASKAKELQLGAPQTGTSSYPER